MRAAFESIATRKGAQAFYAFKISVPSFEFIWHYHPEYELTLILKGTGKRMVGDSYETFDDGDLVLIGPDLPHTWSSEKTKNTDALLEAIVIQFSSSLFAAFQLFSEFTAIKKLLLQCSRGAVFKATVDIRRQIAALPAKSGMEKIAALLQLLERLSTQRPAVLSSVNYIALKGAENEKRINKLCSYVQNNFTKPIRLMNAAKILHLSPSAFCKFAKKALGKTFSDYVNDVRVAHACKLLTETDMPVSSIAFASGFESLTYFNRVFLKKKGMQPNGFRKIN